MITYFISRFCGLVASMLLITSSFAQPSEFKNLKPVLINSGYVKVYENILTEFQKLFANAENVRWYKVDKHFLAKFSINDLEHSALLNPRGKLIYKISYGNEKHLPVNIRKNVKRNHVEFLITSAVLVEEDNRSIWVINLEDDLNYVIVRVENDEMEEIKKYKKM